MALGFAPLGSTPLGAQPSGVVGSTFTIAATATILAFGQVVVPAAGVVTSEAIAAFVGQTISSGVFASNNVAAASWEAQVLVQSQFSVASTYTVQWVAQLPEEILYGGARVQLRFALPRAVSESSDDRNYRRIVNG
jgi:hypothetical protein